MARTQDALPGVETPEIAELETAAQEVGELQEKRSLAKRERAKTKAFVRKPKKRRAKKAK